MVIQHHIARQRHDEQLQRVADSRPQQHFYKFHRHDERRDAAQERIEKALRQKNGRIARKLPDLDAHQSDEHQHNNGRQHDLEDLQKSMDPVNDLFSQSLHSFF